MTAVAVLGLVLVLAGWVTVDHGDDGVEIPLRRLHERRGHARRIDPGIALAERAVEP